MENFAYIHPMNIQDTYRQGTVKHIRKIVYDSPLSLRIFFDQGEIVLNASGDELTAFTRPYSTSGESKITRKVVKKLAKGYDPKMALMKARNDIVQRVSNLEMEALNLGVQDYIARYSGNKITSPESISLYDERSIVENFAGAH